MESILRAREEAVGPLRLLLEAQLVLLLYLFLILVGIVTLGVPEAPRIVPRSKRLRRLLERIVVLLFEQFLLVVAQIDEVLLCILDGVNIGLLLIAFII